MREIPVRSVYYMALVCGVTVLSGFLAGCTATADPDLAATSSPGQSAGRDAASLRTPVGPGPLVQSAARSTTDDEFAVDAREVTRRPNVLSGAQPKAANPPKLPPKLNVLYVANGRIRAYGPAIWIRGTVEDESDGVEVTVNGQKALVKDRSFQRRVSVPPGESEMTVRAEDSDGNVTTSRFLLVRSGVGQSLPAARPPAARSPAAELAASDSKFSVQSGPDSVTKIEDVRDAGVYMVLMAGTASAHFVKMPNLAQCREAVEYTENAACTVHKGRD